MQKKKANFIYKELQERLLRKDFLRKSGLSKKRAASLLQRQEHLKGIEEILQAPQVSCKQVAALFAPVMVSLAGETPKEGWLLYIYETLRKHMYPQSVESMPQPKFQSAMLFYLETLRLFLEQEKESAPFCRTRDFCFATAEEVAGSPYEEDYRRFMECVKAEYIYELMRIGREIMPFDLLAHVAGVHMVAMHAARQMAAAGEPVDLALISAAAVGHDFGKLGCKIYEIKRMPYLHYYYTDHWFTAHRLTNIGMIAANHSTWDLELENLPVESLLLIYADFRVKTAGHENGKEIMGFYSLADSFRVILDKLDNVDQAKENRYRHVYSRLVDFENYMISLGVNVDLTEETLRPTEKKDVALLTMAETVEAIKEISIGHNIELMYRLSRETSFGNILETARSSKNWKNSRAYIDIFGEYFTYMNQKQKQMTLNFLYELMVHREGDIRRQAADLMGNIIATYDVEYTKELPDGASWGPTETDSAALWKKYLEMIVNPGHKIMPRHRRWLGYSLRRVIQSLLRYAKEAYRSRYIEAILDYYRQMDYDQETAFILIDVMPTLPIETLEEAQQMTLIAFMHRYAVQLEGSLEVRAAVLLNLKDFSEEIRRNSVRQAVCALAEEVPVKGEVNLQFLLYHIGRLYGISDRLPALSYERIFREEKVISDIFLENLKAATPWKIKIVNIQLLFDRIERGEEVPKLHIATHFANLLKVSEQVSVRHFAGKTLVRMAKYLSWDQRNEVAVELFRGLEIGEFEFSKYIPQYLGEFILYLHPKELNELLQDLDKLIASTNDRIASVAVDTFGVIMRHYSGYLSRFPEAIDFNEARRKLILGEILRGLANYQPTVRQEAFWVIGHELFGNADWSMEEKRRLFVAVGKKLIALVSNKEEDELAFLHNTAALNYIYGFIGDYLFQHQRFEFAEPQKIAFFPGTFDPFSLGHKEIAKEIRDMGFAVYLALDEFSWSKKTQPHIIRRQIVNMSVANEENIFLFPEDIPINIANSDDLAKLRKLFDGREVYMVAGSDVVKNASAYRTEMTPNCIRTFPHVLFLRDSAQQKQNSLPEAGGIEAEVIELKLPRHLEDISSTRIRENIDNNRDISSLIDPVAQNYIYENSLYLRESQYKKLLEAKDFHVICDAPVSEAFLAQVQTAFDAETAEAFVKAAAAQGSRVTALYSDAKAQRPEGAILYRYLPTAQLYQEFQGMHAAAYFRENASGKIMLITAFGVREKTDLEEVEQIVLAEALAACLEQDYTYSVLSPGIKRLSAAQESVLYRQGYRKIEGLDCEGTVYAVDMKNPVVLFKNMQTVIKEPLNQNEAVLEVLEQNHRRLQNAMTKLYPGQLVISLDSGMMYGKLIERITAANGVPKEEGPVRQLGSAMCVPFGKILKGIVIPNTVTKVLHTDKLFETDVRSFKIKEFPNYLPLKSQVRMIKSFRRPVILVDDLMHKGYRIKELNPIFQEEGLQIDRIIVGVLSGRGKDLMEIQGRKVESAYFIPSVQAWFVESSIYPFIGGDGIVQRVKSKDNLFHAVNLILPYVLPAFLARCDTKAVYDFSMVCLQNAKELLEVLEKEYQRLFERTLTLNRLSEVIISPTCPDKGSCISYDHHLPASVYVENDMEKLVRLRNLAQK